jgi:beta-glucosidase/6-phospho-beta-glucosidase/beta-galactosidase
MANLHVIGHLVQKCTQKSYCRYHEIFDAIEAAGMTINCTLHHFVHPTWFEDMGGFEKKENIGAFVAFATFAAREWGRRIKLWGTFNEPTCLVFGQYFIGVQPPAQFLCFSRMGTVLSSISQHVCNVLFAANACVVQDWGSGELTPATSCVQFVSSDCSSFLCVRNGTQLSPVQRV